MPNLEIELSSNAKEYENSLGFSWIPLQKNPISPLLYLRSCEENFILKPKERKAFSTGLYISIPSNDYVLEVTSFSDIVYEKGIIVLDSPCIFTYYFNNQIYCILYNSSEVDQIIATGDFIANLSLRKKEIITIDLVKQITLKEKNMGKHKWITKEKNKNQLSNKKRTTNNYSREAIKDYINRK